MVDRAIRSEKAVGATVRVTVELWAVPPPLVNYVVELDRWWPPTKAAACSPTLQVPSARVGPVCILLSFQRDLVVHNFELYDTHLFFNRKLTFNLKAFGRLQQPTELCVLDPHLTLVHELDDGAQITEAHVFEDDDRMPGRVVDEQRPEVRRAGGQHNLQIPESSRCSIPETFKLSSRLGYLVGAYATSLVCARQRHVHEAFVAQKLRAHAQKVGLVVVPAQAVVLTPHRQPSADYANC